MAAFVPYLMPEVRRAQGWEICEVPDVAAFDKALHLRAFMKGRERRIGALFEDMWWDGTLVNLHVTKLDGPSPPVTPGAAGRKGRKGRRRGEVRGKGGGARVPFSAKSWGYSAFQYILPELTPETNRCASRFATTASALRASAAPAVRPGAAEMRWKRCFPH